MAPDAEPARRMANAIRMLAVDAVEKAKSGRPGAPMGMAEMAAVVWNRRLRHNPAGEGIAPRATWCAARHNRRWPEPRAPMTDPTPNHGQQVDLVLFDLDGTLVETAPEICDAVNDALRSVALAPVAQRQVSDWIGHGTRELLVHALAGSCGRAVAEVRTSELLQRVSAAYDGFYRQRCGTRSRLYPRVRETLQALRGRGTRLALVTNKESRYTRAVLDAHDLRPLFDRVVSGDDLATRKPDPAGVLSCLQAFGVPAQRALFVGDSSIDVATARNAGIAVWALPYGYNMGQPISASAPDRLIADVSLLLA